MQLWGNKMGKTSIIILSYNTYVLTKQCIESIRKYTEAWSYEIIVVDNNSQDESVAWLKKQRDITTIYNKENAGFPKGCNQGMAIATGSELLLLNSDTVVTPRWLEQLKTALYSDEKIGAVSCMTNRCSNWQQLHTVPYDEKTLNGLEEFAEQYNHSNRELWQERTKLVGFCFLLKDTVYKKIGLMDEIFTPGNFEDDDYSLRILQAGYKLLVCQDTFIHHYGSASFVKPLSKEELQQKIDNYNNLLKVNQCKFYAKWDVPIMAWQSMKPEVLLELQKNKHPDGIWQLDPHKICFITNVNNIDDYNESLANWNKLKVPAGMTVESLAIQEVESITEAYEIAMKSSNAKYKIYLHQDVWIRQKNFLNVMVREFQNHPEYGIAGVVGIQQLPSDEIWKTSNKIGAICDNYMGKMTNYLYKRSAQKSQIATALDGLILITQYDVPWRMDTVNKQYSYDVSHCMEFKKNGFEAVVLPQIQPAVMHWFRENTLTEHEKKRFKNDTTVTFYIVRGKGNVDACIESVKSLKIPGNVSEIKVTVVENYQQAYRYTIAISSEIQIILSTAILLINENFLYDIFNIFESNHNISLLGVRGAKTIPFSGKWWESDSIFGGYCEVQDDDTVIKKIYQKTSGLYEMVQYIDGTIIIQAGLPAFINFDANDYLGERLSHFANGLGYGVAVATPKNPWCMITKSSRSMDKIVLYEYTGYLEDDTLLFNEAKRFLFYGKNAHIGKQGYFSHPSRMYIGDFVQIGDSAYFTLDNDTANITVESYVVLGNMVTIRSHTQVKIGHHADIADYVVLDDTAKDGRVDSIKIGAYVKLENNVAVLGGVTIGNETIVKTGSVVTDNLPAHCIAAGNPAKIIALYDARDNSWKNDLTQSVIEEILQARKENPILSIGIPTYNRSLYLRKCLKFVFDAVDMDDLVEIYVSSNGSEDCTDAIMNDYSGYPNLRYHKHKMNIGVQKNFNSVWENTKGKYVWLLGDDDYISKNVIHDIVHVLMSNMDVTVCGLKMLKEGYMYSDYGVGADNYVNIMLYDMVAITLLIFNRNRYIKLQNKAKYDQGDMPQVYIQLELLKAYPSFCILGTYVAGFGMGDYNRKYRPYELRGNLFDIFFRQFYTLLEYYVHEGVISESTYSKVKREQFWHNMRNCFIMMKRGGFIYRFDDDAMKIFEKYYRREDYYMEAKKILEEAISHERK